MVETVKLKMSATAAGYVRGSTPREEKLKAARGEIAFSCSDLGAVLLFLSLDADQEIKAAAVNTLRDVPEDILAEIAGNPASHPRVLDLLARVHFAGTTIVDKLLAHPAIEERTAEFLLAKLVAVPPAVADDGASVNFPDDGDVPEEAEGADEAQAPVDEEGEEFRSKYKLYQLMGVSEKIKLAFSGDKEWRSLLIKDSNKMVSSAVIKNPRITEQEIYTIANSRIQNDEIIRLICMNKEWIKKYRIRKALAENSKTPVQYSLRFVASLNDKDLATLAKSKNVVTAISSHARRILLSKHKP